MAKDNEDTQTDLQTDLEKRTYEVGYLLVPTLTEEQVPEKVNSLKDTVEKAGGALLSGEEPKLIELAYDMTHETVGSDRKRSIFSKAYFGFIKFEAMGDVAVLIKQELDKEVELLRFMIIKAPKETVFASAKAAQLAIAKKRETSVKKEEKREEAEPISEVELDKAIDELVT